jgi:hypothetical protein
VGGNANIEGNNNPPILDMLDLFAGQRGRYRSGWFAI